MRRRDFLLWAGGLCGAACGKSLGPSSEEPPSQDQPDAGMPPSQTNPILAENAKAGDPNWRSGLRASNGELDLYLSTDSAAAGESVAVMISANPASAANVEIYRVGHYGGAGARRVWSAGPLNVPRQLSPTRDPVTGRVECDWSQTLSFTIGSDWVSGIYLVKVNRSDGFKRFAPLVVRDRRPAEILFKSAFNTCQAYNAWGGESLYRDDSGTMPEGRAYEVSFNRPFSEGDGAGGIIWDECAFARFLEKNGYDVTYATNVDFIRFSDLLNGIGLLAIPGHDEYWAVEERRQLDAALASGRTSLAYFCGNGCFWRVRYLDDRRGRPLRTLVCYKSAWRRDPIPNSTIRFRDPPNAMPENQLFGVMYESWMNVRFPFVVNNPGHWLFEGCGLSAGDELPNLISTEFDHVFDDANTPPDVRIITESPLVTQQGTSSISQAVERSLAAGNSVFAAGTNGWSAGLNPDVPETRDDRVAQMTLNVLEHGLIHRRRRRPTGALGSIRAAGPSTDPRWVSSVDAFAGVTRRPGFADGPAVSARFSGPTGLACNSLGQVFVADTNNHCIRLIDNDAQHTVRTIAGTGSPGFNNGPGAQATFRSPNALIIAPDGAILVVDSDNHVVRRIENNGPTWTVSTYAGTPQTPGFADGPASSARFNRPTGIAMDRLGNAYLAEVEGCRIRMIRGGSRDVTTVAGSGAFAHRDAPVGTNAQFSAPSTLAWASTGELYVLESFSQNVRRISPRDGFPVDTIAGDLDSMPGETDGPGSRARFRAQMGMVVNASGEILLGDSANFRIRKVVPGADAGSTRVYTVAGSGRTGTRLGRGDVADIPLPTGLAFGPNNALFVSDSYNHVIRRITL